MNRVLLGVLLRRRAADLPMKFPDRTQALLGAFFSRFAIGFLATNVSLPFHFAVSGAIAGLLAAYPTRLSPKPTRRSLALV